MKVTRFDPTVTSVLAALCGDRVEPSQAEQAHVKMAAIRAMVDGECAINPGVKFVRTDPTIVTPREAAAEFMENNPELMKRLGDGEGVVLQAVSDAFTILSIGVVYASVCTSLTVEEATEALNRAAPTGISSAWALSDDKTFANGTPMPCPCEPNPATHKHYLFNC